MKKSLGAARLGAISCVVLLPIIVGCDSAEPLDLNEALSAGHVTLHDLAGNDLVYGEGAVTGEIENTSGRPISLNLSLDIPLFFRNLGPAQSMVSTGFSLEMGVGAEISEDGIFVTLAPKARFKVEFLAFCVDEDLDIPGVEAEFVVGEVPDEVLSALHSAGPVEENMDDLVSYQLQLWEALQADAPQSSDRRGGAEEPISAKETLAAEGASAAEEPAAAEELEEPVVANETDSSDPEDSSNR